MTVELCCSSLIEKILIDITIIIIKFNERKYLGI